MQKRFFERINKITAGGCVICPFALPRYHKPKNGQERAKMFDNYKEQHKNIYKNYNFENFTHEDAINIYIKITELITCRQCNNIRQIQNIKTKCTEILNILDKYKKMETLQ